MGPAVGGYLTEAVSWRSLFWINFPFGIVAVVLAFALLPTSNRGQGKIDLPGFAYFTIFATAITVLFMQGQEWGWTSSAILFSAALTLISVYLLLKREKKAHHPFLDLSLFKRPVFAAVNVSISLGQFVLMISVFRTIYLEEILGYTPTQTGLISSVASLPVIFFSTIAGFLSDKVSPKLPLALGFTFVIISFAWLGFFSTPSLTFLFIPLLLFGMGLPMMFNPSYSKGMSSVPPEKIGVASGMIATLRMFGGTMGLALIYLFVDVEQQIHTPTLGTRGAVIESFSAVHFALAGLMAVAFAVTFFLHNRKSSHHLPNSPAEGWD